MYATRGEPRAVVTDAAMAAADAVSVSSPADAAVLLPPLPFRSETSMPIDRATTQVAAGLLRAFESQCLTDYTLTGTADSTDSDGEGSTGSAAIRAHSALLAVRCPQLLDPSHAVLLRATPAHALRTFVRFLYTDQVPHCPSPLAFFTGRLPHARASSRACVFAATVQLEFEEIDEVLRVLKLSAVLFGVGSAKHARVQDACEMAVRWLMHTTETALTVWSVAFEMEKFAEPIRVRRSHASHTDRCGVANGRPLCTPRRCLLRAVLGSPIPDEQRRAHSDRHQQCP
jgi:hypothetical protein